MAIELPALSELKIMTEKVGAVLINRNEVDIYTHIGDGRIILFNLPDEIHKYSNEEIMEHARQEARLHLNG